MGIKIITDSGADLPQEIFEKHNIATVPLEVRFGDKNFLDGVDLSNKDFYKMMEEEEKLPKTASPSPEQFIEEYCKSEDDIIVVTLSSGLSGTFNSALIAREIHQKENKNKKIKVIDSLSASVGEGVIVLKAAQLAEKSNNIEKLASNLRNYARQGQIFFLLDTLENLIKGGRIGRVSGHIGSLLSIKLIMKSDGYGKIGLAEKVRGSKRAFHRLVDIIGENTSDFKKKILAIGHANCYEKAVKYKELVEKKFPFKDTIITSAGATIGTYSGQGGLLVSYIDME